MANEESKASILGTVIGIAISSAIIFVAAWSAAKGWKLGSKASS